MKLFPLLSLVGVLSSTLSFAGSAGCPKLDLAGTWVNDWGVRFKIEQPNCNRVVIHDLSHKHTYALNLDGASKLTFPGTRIENAPSIVKYTYQNGNDTREVTPLLEDVTATGKLIPNKYYQPGNGYPQSEDLAEVNLTALFALPKDNTGKHFYPIKVSATAKVGAYGEPGKEDIYIYLEHPQVVAVGDGQPGPIAKGFMMGINALLNFQELDFFNSSSGNGSYTYLSGNRIFRDLLDHGSRHLVRVKKK